MSGMQSKWDQINTLSKAELEAAQREQREYEKMMRSAQQHSQNATQQSNMMGAMQGIVDPYYTLLGSYGAAQGMQQTPKPVIFGKLLWRGEPLPEGWQGAQYTRKTQVMENRNWRVTFSSPWSNEDIEVNFDSKQYSGQEVDRMAETFLEVINQRRLG